MTDEITTITASIDPDALDKTSRFFNASLQDILTELLQNARRAGAATVTVTQSLTEITVADDGGGIDQPDNLLAFGGSGWARTIASLEDPAGMGLFSLSRRGCRIYTRPKGVAVGWCADLTPDVFRGKTTARIDKAYKPEGGTTITFPIDHGLDGKAETTLQRIARHYPLPVICNTKSAMEGKGFERIEIEREDFLKPSVAIARFDAGRIGVIPKQRRSNDPALNFHGLTVSPSTPQVTQRFGRPNYHAIYDFHGGGGLELVLPARKELVQNEAWRDLQRHGRLTIFRHIAASGDHTLDFKDYKAARELGVDLPEAIAKLTPYTPPTNDHQYGAYVTEESIEDAGMIVALDDEPVVHQCLARALNNAGFDGKLYEPCSAYEGYDWYDALPRITAVSWAVEKNGADLCFDDPEEDHVTIDGDPYEKPSESDLESYLDADLIKAVVTIERDGEQRTACFDTDIVLFGEGWSPDEITVFIAKGAKENGGLDPDELSALIVDSYFCPSDDAEANSYQTQRRDYEIAAYARACDVLIGKEAGLIAFIRDHANEHVSWTCPSNRRVVIAIKGFKVDVAFRERGAEDAADDLVAALRGTLPYLEAHMAMTASSEDMGDRIAYDRALAAIEKATVSPPDA